MFEVGTYCRINYKNQDYVKILTCLILEEDKDFIKVRDKFRETFIVNKSHIIDCVSIPSHEVENPEAK